MLFSTLAIVIENTVEAPASGHSRQAENVRPLAGGEIRVSQNCCEISQISQSRFLRGLSASRSLKFFKVVK